jgi:hypothetical protein
VAEGAGGGADPQVSPNDPVVQLGATQEPVQLVVGVVVVPVCVTKPSVQI